MTDHATLPESTLRLGIRRLQLMVRLGVGEGERWTPQPVELDIDFFFGYRPSACEDDDGAYVCYDGLASALAAYCDGREFRLIEFLAARLLAECRRYLDAQPGIEPERIGIGLTLIKCAVPIDAVLGDCRVTLGQPAPAAA